MADDLKSVGSNEQPETFTVREMIARLAKCEDMDAEVRVSVYNSDSIPVVDVEEDSSEGVVILKDR